MHAQSSERYRKLIKEEATEERDKLFSVAWVDYSVNESGTDVVVAANESEARELLLFAFNLLGKSDKDIYISNLHEIKFKQIIAKAALLKTYTLLKEDANAKLDSDTKLIDITKYIKVHDETEVQT